MIERCFRATLRVLLQVFHFESRQFVDVMRMVKRPVFTLANENKMPQQRVRVIVVGELGPPCVFSLKHEVSSE